MPDVKMIDMQDTNITLMNECKIPCEMLLCGRYGKFESVIFFVWGNTVLGKAVFFIKKET